MRVWVVTKAPVDLPGTQEFIGAFTTESAADKAVQGAGTYTIAEMEADRRYSGDLRAVQITVKLDCRQAL
jgi:hypothetical protein